MSDFPLPSSWNRDTKEVKRDERKRRLSPASFFYSQGKALVLAAGYFHDGRLAPHARGGVATKHRHRIGLALFGQLMAAFEYMLKDFVAQQIDASSHIDAEVNKAEWIDIDSKKLLSLRSAPTTIGAMLVHSTLGWHNPEQVNSRYQALFGRQPIASSETDTLERLWVVRHSVAHNAGFMIAHDAARIGGTGVSEKLIDLGAGFMDETFEFLCAIAERVATLVGQHVLVEWLRSQGPLGQDATRDLYTYSLLKYMATYVGSRPKDLEDVGEAEYAADFQAANP